jgi:hypothetical protein
MIPDDIEAACGIGTEAVILQVRILVGGRDPQVEGSAGVMTRPERRTLASGKHTFMDESVASPRGGMEPAPPFICGSRPRTKSRTCSMTVFVLTPASGSRCRAGLLRCRGIRPQEAVPPAALRLYTVRTLILG